MTILLLIAAACGSDDATAPTSSGAHDDHDTSAETADFAFGQPGSPAEADEKVSIVALDSLRFDPASVDVGVGDTLSFKVTNKGDDPHEFVLGDREFQEEHAQNMDGGHSMEGSHLVEVQPGATKTITWTFTEAGAVLFACHEPGHYEGGMVGTVSVGA